MILSLLLICGVALAEQDYKSIISDCPKSPNCVSTLTDQEDKKMEPIPFSADESQVIIAIDTVVKAQARVEIKESSADSMHAVFTTFLMRYQDDVYFWVDAENKLIHFKSQSRVGYSDLGKNKSRMNDLVSQINKLL